MKQPLPNNIGRAAGETSSRQPTPTFNSRGGGKADKYQKVGSDRAVGNCPIPRLLGEQRPNHG